VVSETAPFSYPVADGYLSFLLNFSFCLAFRRFFLIFSCFLGKSTILKLITRMLDPTSGEILLDGIPVKGVTLESLRKRIASVPQDSCLFDETILYNIRYGKPDATEEEINEAIDKANLRATINKLPAGLETKVGERGARLSGGERQKVSIAR
jgi:ABC-type multidrug transport system fused ATPase/permease subunit